VLLLLLTCQQHAQASGILAVSGTSAGLYARFMESFIARLATGDADPGAADVTTVYLDRHDLTQADLAASSLVVAVGSEAARTVSSLKPEVPVLYTLIPESVYRTLGPATGACAMRSAIFIDQPLARQAALAQALFPAAVNYGVLLGPTSSQRQAEIDELKNTTDRQLVVSAAGHEANIARATNGLLNRIDLLLAVNDPLVLNRENAKWLLYSAYQHRLPVIGFSQAYVNAGAAGAVFSEPEQMARQAAEIVQRQAAMPTGCLPAAGFPVYFSVAINQSVCSSLGGASCDENTLDALLNGKEIPE
jgi:putative ABC transport system substrate-binding protein